MSWHAALSLHYQHEAGRTRLHFTHDGPLRVLQSLYPEGEGICHNVLIHPPGGLVQGDTLEVHVQVDAGAHALISTPGATRFYRSTTHEPATQCVHLALAAGARLEWLPLETLAYPGCHALNHLTLALAPTAQLLAWDVTALGLPAAGQAFEGDPSGVFQQTMHWPGVWLEQGRIAATDTRLLESSLGLAGRRGLGTLVMASGTPWTPLEREALLHTLQATVAAHPLSHTAGATSPNPQLIVLRALAPMTESLFDLFKHAWAKLRTQAWGLPPQAPRIWSV